MFEKLGKKALALPIGICIVLCCVLSLALGPLLRAEPSNVPFAIVNLDKGAITIAGDSNIGNGVRSLVYFGQTPNQNDIMPFVWFGIVGVLALVVTAIKAHKSSSQK